MPASAWLALGYGYGRIASACHPPGPPPSRGLTSPALAEKLEEHGVKVDPDHILAVELGHRGAGYDLRVAWADELGIRPGDIHFEADLRELITLADKDREVAA